MASITNLPTPKAGDEYPGGMTLTSEGFGMGSYAVNRHATNRSMGGAKRFNKANADNGVGGLRPLRKLACFVIGTGEMWEWASYGPGGLAVCRTAD